MSEPKSVDDILIKSMQNQSVSNNTEQQSSQTTIDHKQEPPQEIQKQEATSQAESHQDNQKESSIVQETDNKQQESSKPDESQQQTKESKTDYETKSNEYSSPIDEYGNPIAKSRLYTEEELNQRIRDRLSRGKYADQQEQQHQYQPQHQPQQQTQFTQQQVNQAKSDGFEHDPNSEETWDVQLRKFMNQVMDEREAQRAEQQWRQQETRKQEEFQDKFTSGMSKYNDFHEVVRGKPITDSMMMATRNLDNPAAFVYGASKLHPQELDRIARIGDPYVQAAEIGRLHERMVKERRAVTNAPKPLNAPKGDVPNRVSGSQPSIEQRIHDYGKQRRK